MKKETKINKRGAAGSERHGDWLTVDESRSSETVKRKAAKSANNSWSSLRGETNLEKGETEGVGRQRGRKRENKMLSMPLLLLLGQVEAGRQVYFLSNSFLAPVAFVQLTSCLVPPPTYPLLKNLSNVSNFFCLKLKLKSFYLFFTLSFYIDLIFIFLCWSIWLPVHKHLAIH